jgi:hypothetical protein
MHREVAGAIAANLEQVKAGTVERVSDCGVKFAPGAGARV